jgi:hypothetical protein
MSRSADADKRRPPGPSWPRLLTTLLLAGAVFLLLLAVLGFLPLPFLSSLVFGKRIDGIPCQTGEQVAYHVHAHLQILDAGRTVTLPANVGIRDDLCLYWLHTHDTSGIIHIEAPHSLRPTLGTFFDIWGMPLTRRAMGPAKVRNGQSIRVYVDRRPYRGNPRRILLGAHTLVTIEIGPPFQTPQGFNFDGY